ncbi:hypothetical protein Q9L42_020495 (plasmid) [Methylomarinum sp. Ch1-1]|uniref:Uncharacterized protein n=1 Tax=Methylomarinum roseum TaxID=3067653 RepID=A0AAU7P080_9GAMM
MNSDNQQKLFGKLIKEFVDTELLPNKDSSNLNQQNFSQSAIHAILEKAYLVGLSEQPPKKIQTEDGYVFFRNEAGQYVDHLDPESCDMSYESLADFDVNFVEIQEDDDRESPTQRPSL